MGWSGATIVAVDESLSLWQLERKCVCRVPPRAGRGSRTATYNRRDRPVEPKGASQGGVARSAPSVGLGFAGGTPAFAEAASRRQARGHDYPAKRDFGKASICSSILSVSDLFFADRRSSRIGMKSLSAVPTPLMRRRDASHSP